MKPVLVDTSIWVDHFRRGNKALEQLLIDDLVMTHPLVIGELWTLDKRLGGLAKRFGVNYQPPKSTCHSIAQ